MARTLVASDNFDSYADASNLGSAADWLELNGSTGLIRVSKPASNGVAYEHFGARSECRWDGAETFANDQYAKGTIAQLFITADTTQYIGAAVRMSPDTLTGRDYYAVLVYDAASAGLTSTHVIKVLNNSVSDIYAKQTGDSWTNGDTVSIEAVDNGANVDLLIYKNDILLRTVSDTASVLASGKPGLSGVGNSGSGTAPAFTDWEGGDITSGGGGFQPAWARNANNIIGVAL